MRPPGAAHSPIAHTCGSEVRQRSSTSTPPRSATSSPAARASASRGRMPAEKTTTCASTGSSSLSASPVTRPSSPSTSWVIAPVWMVSPSRSMWRLRVAPPPSSTCTAIRRGAISTTWVFRPSWARALAASRPSSPPPITAPTVAPAAASRIASRSSIVRYTKQPSRSCPGTGGTNGAAPVASTSSSYAITSPSLSSTVPVSGSRPSTATPRLSRTRGSSYTPVGSSDSWSAPTSKKEVRATRSYAGRGSSPTTTMSWVSVRPRSMAACTKRWPTMPCPTTTRVLRRWGLMSGFLPEWCRARGAVRAAGERPGRSRRSRWWRGWSRRPVRGSCRRGSGRR